MIFDEAHNICPIMEEIGSINVSYYDLGKMIESIDPYDFVVGKKDAKFFKFLANFRLYLLDLRS